MQLKRLKLRKNNWDCETYQFDEILSETASQKRVYEVVAKPVVEVLSGPSCFFVFLMDFEGYLPIICFTETSC